LNRLTVQGECRLRTHDPDPLDVHEPIPAANHNDYVFGRFTDLLDPNKIYNMSTHPQTLNESLWMDRPYDGYIDYPLNWGSIVPQDSIPMQYVSNNQLLGSSTIPPSLILQHPAQPNDERFENDSLPNNRFEHFQWHPIGLRTVNHYDEFPMKHGVVWSWCPDDTIWSAMSVGGSLNNLKGRFSAIAYRESGEQAFNYMVFSYDPRGRVEAFMRYTENLGFDAVYYTYNSMNAVTSIRVADPLRQFCMWYGYDYAGRVDSVGRQFMKTACKEMAAETG
jgi:hypothetical protein